MANEDQVEQHGDKFLPSLARAAELVHAQSPIETKAFAAMMDAVCKIFDHLGAVLHIAKSEMDNKTGSLHSAATSYPTLGEVIAADKAQGTVTVKDSCSRNLHRLLGVIKFLRVLLDELMSSPKMTLHEAAKKAYDQSLASVHPYLVRCAVSASMYVLPAREKFLREIGETEESARQWAAKFLKCSLEIEAKVLDLFQDVKMPVSSPSTNILSALMGGTAKA